MKAATRERVVEMLRCAADNRDWLDSVTHLKVTQIKLGESRYLRHKACDAFLAVNGPTGDDWVAACLEVALVVEQGGWP